MGAKGEGRLERGLTSPSPDQVRTKGSRLIESGNTLVNWAPSWAKVAEKRGSIKKVEERGSIMKREVDYGVRRTFIEPKIGIMFALTY